MGKYIIDIPDKMYEDAKNGKDTGESLFITQAIKNATPYKPIGDLISREALKDITYINKGNFNTVEGIREWIDNAQAVEHSLLPLSSEADNAYMRGYEVGKAEGILKASTRPTGDCISREALKKQLKELLDLAVRRVNDTPNNSPCYRMYVEQENERARLIDLIDNAPPVAGRI